MANSFGSDCFSVIIFCIGEIVRITEMLSQFFKIIEQFFDPQIDFVTKYYDLLI